MTRITRVILIALAWCSPGLASETVEYETTPYAAIDKAFEKALTLKARGKPERAAKVLESADSAPEASRDYAAARLLSAAGKSKEWLRKLSNVAKSNSPLAPYAALELARYYLEHNQKDESIALLKKAIASPALMATSGMELVQILGDVPQSAEILEATLAAIHDPARRAKAAIEASKLANEDRPECRLRLLHQLYFQDEPPFDVSKELAAAWKEEFPDAVFLRTLLVDHAGKWSRDLEALVKRGKEDSFAAHMLHGAIALRHRKKNEALAHFEEAELKAGSRFRESMAIYFKGRTLESLDKDLEALDAYDRLLAFFPEFPIARKVQVRSATIALREGAPLEAVRRVDAILASTCRGEDVSAALWIAGRLAWLQGRWTEAVKLFDKLAREYFFARASKWVTYGPAALFWEALALGKAGDEAQSAEILSLLASEAGCTWYGVAARSLCKAEMIHSPPAPGSLSTSHLEVPNRLHLPQKYAAAVELFRLGEWDASYREMLALIGTGLLAKGVVRFMGAAYFRSHGTNQSVRFRQQVGLLPPPWDGGSRLWYHSLPLSYVAALDCAAEESWLDRALMASIVKFESNFNPKAVSSADAVGLLQVRENAGNHVAVGCLGEKRVKLKELQDPTYNCRLGSIYMAELIRRHHGNWPVSLAAYNAGPATAGLWVQRFSGLGTMDFVEQITFPNTAGYVKGIMGIVELYWSLHHPVLGQEPPAVGIPPDIPDEVNPFLDEPGGSCENGTGYHPPRQMGSERE